MKANINVLVVFANPASTGYLNLGKEDRIIQKAIQASKYRALFKLKICHATTIHDLRNALIFNYENKL